MVPRVVASALYQRGEQPEQDYVPPQVTAPTFVAPEFAAPSFVAPNVSAPIMSSIPTLSIALPTWDGPRDWRTDLRTKVRNSYKSLMARAAQAIHDKFSGHGPSLYPNLFNGPGNAASGALFGPPGKDYDTDPGQIYFDSAGLPLQAPDSQSAYAMTTAVMDRLADGIAGGLEDIVNTIVPTDITRFRDKVQTSLNTSLGEYTGKINETLDEYKGNIDGMMNGYNTDLKDAMRSYTEALTAQMNEYTNRMTDQMNVFSSNLTSALNQVTALAQRSINESINQLYAFIGLPKDTKASLVEMRAITVDGFQFLSQGNTEINWLAIGDN